MKKILVVFVLSLSILSCSKDDNSPKEENNNASYELKIDGNAISSNSSIPLEMLLDGNIAMSISVQESDDLLSMAFSKIPTTVGSISILNNNDNILVAITGTRIANYSPFGQIFIDQGTMTRTANDKVSFTGTFENNGITYNATGYIKSDGLINH